MGVESPPSLTRRSKMRVGAIVLPHGMIEPSQPIPAFRGAYLPCARLCGSRYDLIPPSRAWCQPCFRILSFIRVVNIHLLDLFLVFPCLIVLQHPLIVMRQDISTHQSGGIKDHPDARKAKTNVDCLVVGAGFGGVYPLNHLRKAGYSCQIFEAGSDLG